MLVLRLLNVVAPAYFLCISLVTFVLQIFLFIPSMFTACSYGGLIALQVCQGGLLSAVKLPPEQKGQRHLGGSQ